ncbi:MAG: hypothetical protein F6K42_14160 [Leptolyngbya sp. SIO1D8]|nr:hypothetical protein [Leptolyngbya sp. SIO1D8]
MNAWSLRSYAERQYVEQNDWMTPEAIRIISQIRHEFHASLAEGIGVPVNITKGTSYSSNFPKISWTDSDQRLNYVYVYAHVAPDTLIPDRPLILRVGVNKGLGLEPAKRVQKKQKTSQKLLQFELTLLPDEIFDFVPWLISLLRFYAADPAKVISPPCTLNPDTLDELILQGAWTPKAKQCFAQQATAPTVNTIHFFDEDIRS